MNDFRALQSLWKKKFNMVGKNTIVKPINYHFLGILGFNYLLKFWNIAVLYVAVEADKLLYCFMKCTTLLEFT